MIGWLGLALASAGEPTEADLRAAARLLVDEATVVQGVTVEAELREGLPWIDVANTGSTPLEIRWSTSRIQPPNGDWLPVVPVLRDHHDREVRVAPVVLPPGDGSGWTVLPLPWFTDATDDAEQVAAWTRTSFSGLELSLVRDGTPVTYRALWRTQVDLDLLHPEPEQPLALVAEPVVRPPPVDLQARRRWDANYRLYRQQARTSRSIWVTSLVVGGLATLAGLTALDGALATDDPDQRARFERTALIYGGVTAASAAVTVGFVLTEKKANQRLRGLGRRP